ncbi:unnamed protein product, partial [Sphagnum compactum]
LYQAMNALAYKNVTHICNDHECPSNAIDFREEQCKNFNSQLFGGKKYLWEAYLK